MQQPGPFATSLPARRIAADGENAARHRIVAAETPVAISVLGLGYAVMMATPADLEDFAYGFALSERLIDSAADAGDLALQRRDPRLQLGDRERIQILGDELSQQVVGAQRQIVRLHALQR